MNLARMLVLALVSDGVVAVGDVLAKKWSAGRIMSLWGLGAIFCYIVVSGLWLAVLRAGGGNLGRSAIFWASTGVIVPVLLGRFAFGEAAPWNVWLGMALCSVGLVFVAAR